MSEQVNEIQREMLRKLRNNITDEEFDLMKREIQQKDLGGFGPGEIQRHVTTIDAMFDRLIRKQIFKVGNYKKLHKLFRLIESEQHRDTVREAEMKLRSINYPVEEDEGSDSSQQVPQQGHHPAVLHPGSYIPQGATYMPHAAPPHYAPQLQYMGASQYDSQQFAAPRGPALQPVVAHPQPSMLGPYDLRHPQSSQVSMSDKLPRGSSMEEDVFRNVEFDHRVFYEPGKCYVLFINNLFTGRSGYREGAERDEDNIRRLFRDLGENFYLQYTKDVTKGQLESYLSALQSTLGSGLYKSFILILGSHGEPQSSRTGGPEKDGVLMADCRWMLVDDIIKHFHGDKIPAMKDMPKIFIIQSCRGKEHARSVSYSDAPAELSTPGMLHSVENPDYLTRPVNSDVLIAYATTEGTKAWRNSDEGSWFVHDLCDVIAEFKDKEHILDILVRVNNRMVWRESSEGRAKQMPCFVCTFTKRFMFKYK
ncbi:caspase-3-like [Diadema setosum]|uniref:caspase-3-like n=1 Tax=Diadema setosum TaxID=31175 RepID=UPI003B3AE2FB